MPQRRTASFYYRQGALVTIGTHGTLHYRIVQQRATWRDTLGPLYEYLCERVVAPSVKCWMAEADLVPVKEK